MGRSRATSEMNVGQPSHVPHHSSKASSKASSIASAGTVSVGANSISERSILERTASVHVAPGVVPVKRSLRKDSIASVGGTKQNDNTLPGQQYHCLILSTSLYQGKLFEAAAVSQLWKPFVCNDVESAAKTAAQQRSQLVLLDLQTALPQTRPALCELTEAIIAINKPLVIVCGSEDALEEIWARQHGIWLYLPGINEETDLALLFGEAKNVAEKRRVHSFGPPNPQAIPQHSNPQHNNLQSLTKDVPDTPATKQGHPPHW